MVRHNHKFDGFAENMKRIYQTTIFALLVFCITSLVVAQKEERFPTRQQSEFADARPNYCWYNELHLAYISQGIPTDKTIIVIARLGDRDLKPNLNKRRLHNIRAYLTQAVSEQFRREPQTIILAEGEPVKGFGQVEFYLDGRLIEVLKLHRNSDFVIDCYGGVDGADPCAEDWQKLFYPCKDEVEKQNRKVVPKKKKSRK